MVIHATTARVATMDDEKVDRSRRSCSAGNSALRRTPATASLSAWARTSDGISMVAERSMRASALSLFAIARRANHLRSGFQRISQQTACVATPRATQPATAGTSAAARGTPAKITASARLLIPIVMVLALMPAVDPKT